MTLTAVLRSLPEFELVTLNFSSTTTPKLLLDTLSHYCKVEKTPNGLVMHPVLQGKWLVIVSAHKNFGAKKKGFARVGFLQDAQLLTLSLLVLCFVFSSATRLTCLRWINTRPWL